MLISSCFHWFLHTQNCSIYRFGRSFERKYFLKSCLLSQMCCHICWSSFDAYSPPKQFRDSDTKSYNYATFSYQRLRHSTCRLSGKPSLKYDDPMRMPKLHALLVWQRKRQFSSSPTRNLNWFFLYMYELYSVCASLLCKSQKMMKQNKKDDEA